MKKYIAIAAISAFTLGACSENTSDVDSSQPQVRLVGEMSSSNVSRSVLKGGGDVGLAAGETVDSLRITRIKTLISRIKLHRSASDSTGDRDFKSAPVIIVAAPDTTYSISTQPIPAGTYDKVKFEFHKLSGSEVSQYQNDTNFRDFSGSDRATFIIEGVLYKDGAAQNFTFKSDATANLTLNIEPALTLTEGTTTTLALRYDPFTIFKINGEGVLDPRDSKNEGHIDNMIKNAIRAIKK
jgi:hypothetical protein